LTLSTDSASDSVCLPSPGLDPGA